MNKLRNQKGEAIIIAVFSIALFIGASIFHKKHQEIKRFRSAQQIIADSKSRH